jgi:hypothetical protein
MVHVSADSDSIRDGVEEGRRLSNDENDPFQRIEQEPYEVKISYTVLYYRDTVRVTYLLTFSLSTKKTQLYLT